MIHNRRQAKNETSTLVSFLISLWRVSQGVSRPAHHTDRRSFCFSILWFFFSFFLYIYIHIYSWDIFFFPFLSKHLVPRLCLSTELISFQAQTCVRDFHERPSSRSHQRHTTWLWFTRRAEYFTNPPATCWPATRRMSAITVRRYDSCWKYDLSVVSLDVRGL